MTVGHCLFMLWTHENTSFKATSELSAQNIFFPPLCHCCAVGLGGGKNDARIVRMKTHRLLWLCSVACTDLSINYIYFRYVFYLTWLKIHIFSLTNNGNTNKASFNTSFCQGWNPTRSECPVKTYINAACLNAYTISNTILQICSCVCRFWRLIIRITRNESKLICIIFYLFIVLISKIEFVSYSCSVPCFPYSD